MRNICVLTATRAEFGLLSPLLRAINDDDELRLQLVVTGTHLSKAHGFTVKQIEESEFRIDRKITIPVKNSSSLDIANALSTGVRKYALAFDELKPDIVVLLGDRHETFAAATAAFVLKMPIAHIHGGEVTRGALDDGFRHSISKLSSIHFTASKIYANRLARMGEPPSRIHNCGALGLDNIKHYSPMGQSELERVLQFRLNRPFAIVTYHPETLSSLPPGEQVDNVLSAVEKSGIHAIFTMPNADEGGDLIAGKIKTFTEKSPDKYLFRKSLGMKNYLSVLSYANCMVGNSSSGIIEAPSFGLPVVNVGDRQSGRFHAENILNVPNHTQKILAAIRTALKTGRMRKTHPFGSGNAAGKITKRLKSVKLSALSLQKGFYDE